MAESTAVSNISERARPISRRSFILGLGGLLAGGAILRGRAVAAASGLREARGAAAGLAQHDPVAPADKTTLAAPDPQATAFSALVGQRFAVRGGGAAQEMELARVQVRAWRAAQPQRIGQQTSRGEAFSLMFVGASERTLPQGTYRFEHARTGAFYLLIVPMATNERGQLYEAAFNLLQA